ncbi:uncharacterized protein YndB with AHSA1/START domain [Shinella sp. BE166]|uniref:SRPBCC domain-containing protein n=1 Tax=Shinella sp. BE166 TaxID=3373918 RepID=UPI003EB957A6
MSIEQGTVDITKTFAAPVAAVFAAWSQKTAQLAWGDPGPDWQMSFERFRFTVGESDLCRFGPKDGSTYLNENRYLEITPDRRIVYASTLQEAGILSFSGTVVVTFEPADGGTRMRLVEQGLYFDGRDRADDHREGWRAMLEAMAGYLKDAPCTAAG